MSATTAPMDRAEAIAKINDYHRILLPDAESFADVCEYLGEWGASSPPHDGYRLHADGDARQLVKGIEQIGRDLGVDFPEDDPEACNVIGPYCQLDLRQLGEHRHRSLAVRPTDAVVACVAPRIVTADDHLSFKIIGHKWTGRALVILEHGQILGSHWLAYINPATIPPVPAE